MDKVKVLVLGLGNFGHSWAVSVLPACSDFAILAGVVDRQKETWKGIAQDVPKFEVLESALDQTKPDLVINVTPPALHYELTAMLLRKNLAVLCEKPIADSYENALKMGAVLEETKGFLAIGENYRYHTILREAKKLLQEKTLGKIHQLQCCFRHYHPDYSLFYHGTLTHPLLEDVTIHHLDLARYLSGEEPLNVWCREFSAEYSWYGMRPASAVIVTKMTGNVTFTYQGTLASPVSTTDWKGEWEIECDKGVLAIDRDKITIYTNNQVEEISISEQEEDSRVTMLRETCTALRERRKAETDYGDNLKTFTWMQ